MDHAYDEKTNHFSYFRISKYVSAFKTEFMYGGYLTAMALPLLVLCMSLLMDKPVSWRALAISYLLPLIIYGYDYYMGRDSDAASNPERAIIVGRKAHAFSLILAAEGLMLAALLLMWGNSGLTIFISIMMIGGVAYPVFFKDVTRMIPGFKSVYVSLIWAAAAVFISFFQYSTGLSIFIALAFVFIFLKTMINVIFFDIKDIEADRKRGLKTIPALLGKEGTFKFLHGLNLLTLAPILTGVYSGSLPAPALAWLGLSVYVFYYLYRGRKSDEKGIRHISYALAESETILWLALIVIGKAAFSIF